MPGRVDALEALSLVAVAAGDSFSVVVDDAGLVYTAGRNSQGQLGLGHKLGLKEGDRPAPKLVRALRGVHVIAVAAGARHVLVLTDGGAVYTWGANKDGELGNGHFVDSDVPILCAGLAGKPVVAIAAGGHHSMALLVTGHVFVWGANSAGQLGLGDTTPRLRPTLLRVFAHKSPLRNISCGDFHSCFMLENGALYGCGSSKWGQLGLGQPRDTVLIPTLLQDVVEMGSVVSVACGRRHTACVIQQSSGAAAPLIVTFGSNSEKQLGLTSDHPGFAAAERQSPVVVRAASGVSANTAAAGGNFCIFFFGAATNDAGLPPLLAHWAPVLAIPSALSAHTATVLFSSASTLNAVFYVPMLTLASAPVPLGVPVDWPKLHAFYGTATLDDEAVRKAIGHLAHGVRALALADAADFVFVFALLHAPVLLVPERCPAALELLMSFLAAVSNKSFAPVFRSAYAALARDDLARVVLVVHTYLSHLLSAKGAPMEPVTHAVLVLADLHAANTALLRLSPDAFAVAALDRHPDLEIDWQNTQSQRGSTVFTLCKFSFLLSTTAKERLLRSENRLRMSENLLLGALTGEAPFLILEVRRSHLLHDSLQQMAAWPSRPQFLQRPFKIKFAGELGVDEGGLLKEYFQDILPLIYSKAFRLTEAKLLWFPRAVDDESLSLCSLVGLLWGLAVYNSALVPPHFPSLIFQYLVQTADVLDSSLANLRQVFPDEAKNLQFLLSYEGDDFCSLFMDTTFEVTVVNNNLTPPTYETHELIPSGSQTPVTVANRALFAQLYAAHLLVGAAEAALIALKAAFLSVCSGPAFHLFDARDLELIMCGTSECNLLEFESRAKYQGYTVDSPQVKWFWEVVNSLDSAFRRKFLLFVTGSTRVPFLSAESQYSICVMKGADVLRLPSASTCFNALTLPAYTSKHELGQRLLLAIQETEGFGLV